jgi:PAS domain S-box-containing protein
MIDGDLLEAVLRNLCSGAIIWKLEDPADACRLRLVFANPAASRWTGVDLAAGLGKLIGEIDPQAVQERRHEILARVATTGVEESIDADGRPAAAGVPKSRARVVPLPGRCVAVIVERDAVDQVAENDAQRLTAFLDSIVENIPAMVFVKDAEGLRYQLFNRGVERLTGRKREDVLGRNAREIGLPPEQVLFFEQKDREVLGKGVLLDIPEEPVQTGSGERRWLHTKKIPILDAGGKARYMLGISLDITDSKRVA